MINIQEELNKFALRFLKNDGDFQDYAIQIRHMSFLNLPIYDSNNAAKLGGLTAGKIYRTSGDPSLIAVVF